MNKKIFIIIVILIIFTIYSCNAVSFNEDSSTTQNNKIELKEDQTNLSDTSINPITTTQNKQVTSSLTDGQTFIEIKAPKSIGFKPFGNENYVSLKDFNFGDYLPMVKLIVPNSGRNICIYDYAILSEGCTDLNDGENFYNILNLKFSLSSNKKLVNNYSSVIANYLGKRRILKISEDGKEVLCGTIIDVSKSSSDNYIFNTEHIFDVIVDVFDGHTLIQSEKIIKNETIPMALDDLIAYVRDYNFGVQPSNYRGQGGFYIIQQINSNYLLGLTNVDIPKYSTDEKEFYGDGENINNGDVYLIKLDGSKYEYNYIGSYMFNPVISPDLKYIIYNSPNGEGADSYFTQMNKLEDMQTGFYIKNIETSETTFVPIDEKYKKEFNAVGWIKKDGLEALLK